MSKLKYVTDFRGDGGGSSEMLIKQEPTSPPQDFSPCVDPDVQFTRLFDDMKVEPPSPQPLSRPSLSMSDLSNIRQDARLDLGGRRENHRDVMRRYSRKPSSSVGSPPPLSRSTKYVSMAEAIYHFQRDTPGRFHTTGARTEFQPRPASPIRASRTRPQSPALRCATRARPLRLPTAEEREQREFEEMRNYKIKANPVPKSVVHGGHLPDVVRRDKTVPEPFKLTEMPRRPPRTPEPEFVFTARPAPRHILEKAQVPPKPPSTITNPITPQFLRERAKSQDIVRKASTPPHQHRRPPFKRQTSVDRHVEVPHHGVGQFASRLVAGPLRVEPFSFDKRDEYTKKKKEEKINQIISEQKKMASQFKANPVPKVIIKKASEHLSSKRSNVSTVSSENKENYKFEARPPVVLSQKPFKPVLTQSQITEQKPFALASLKRAAEREQFDKQLKEKEEEARRLAEKREKERKAAEEEERARLRAQLVHHAQPVPDLLPFVPEKSSAPLTEPQTPMFVRRLKKAVQ